jgi:hypothetical protein
MSALFTPYRLGLAQAAQSHRDRADVSILGRRGTRDRLIHLGNLALFGAGLLIIEATAVLPDEESAPTISAFGLPKPKRRWVGWSKPCGGIQTYRSPSGGMTPAQKIPVGPELSGAARPCRQGCNELADRRGRSHRWL